jgi:hypothetical protein
MTAAKGIVGTRLAGPGTRPAALVRSPGARARITSIGLSAAPARPASPLRVWQAIQSAASKGASS